MSWFVAATSGPLKCACIAALTTAIALTAPALAQDNTFIMAMTTTPKGFDSDIWVPGQIETSVNVYEGLTRFGTRPGANGQPEIEPGKFEPHFAESWTVSADGTTYVFRLRPGVALCWTSAQPRTSRPGGRADRSPTGPLR